MGDRGYTSRVVHPGDIDAELARAWLELEEQAAASNPCLSPSFVIPALEHLSAGLEVVIILVEAPVATGAGLVGLGVFRRLPASRSFPLARLAGYRSRHSPISGALLHREHLEGAAGALARALCVPGADWHGVEFSSAAVDDAGLQAVLDRADGCGARWFERERWSRAALEVREAGEAYLEAHLSARRRKSLRRSWRQLDAEGGASWRALVGTEIAEPDVERFLALEDSGWKGEAGSSLLARPGNERFFREMFAGFCREGRAFMTELRVGDRVIASSTNLISAGNGLLFKAGWHPDFARFSPGVLSEVELTRRAPALLPGLSLIDGAAVPGAYLDDIWAGRRWMRSGLLATSAAGRHAARVLAGLRGLARRLRRRPTEATRTPDESG